MTRREKSLLAAIKVMHTIVFVVSASAIFFALWAGLTGVLTPLVWLALAIPALVWLGLKFNGDECILQTWSKKLQRSPHWVSDIYIPDWLALRVRTIFTPLYALAAVLVTFRLLLSL